LAKKKNSSRPADKKNLKQESKAKSYPKTPRRSAPVSKKAQRRIEAKKREIPWFIIGLFGFIIVVIAVLIIFRIAGATERTALPLEISLQEAHRKYQQGAFLLDVREQHEWDEYHVPDSKLIPLGELDQRLREIPRNKDIVVICRNGNRSQEGRDILLQAGFTRVTSMAGGIAEWEMLNFPIARSIQ
jgi:rhodanese-related sulfurtransferase